MVIFYTLPPNNIAFPYILLNAHHPNLGYIKRYHKNIKSIIIDSGIEIFRSMERVDYPRNYEYRIIKIYNFIRQFVEETYLTVPDYCDDYHPGHLWISDMSNIERTIVNVAYYTSKYNLNWLIPIQGWYKNPDSVYLCLKYYDTLDILEKFEYFGIAMLCTENNMKIIHKTIKNVKSVLNKDEKLHVFGLKIKTLRKVYKYIYSFDSMAWTRPVNSYLKKYFSDRKNRSVR